MNRLEQLRRPALIIGCVFTAASLVAALYFPGQFFRSYLIGYLFWLAVALGCLPLLMLYHLAGGKWGAVIRGILESGARTLPLLALLFLPIPAGMHWLYPWSNPDLVAGDISLIQKSPYLNVPFFLLRAAIYFAAWIWIARTLNRWAAAQQQSNDPLWVRKFQSLSAGGLLAYALTLTFASIDWAMSLEPHWFSTIYGMLFIVGQVLAALAFVIPIAVLLSSSQPMSDMLQPDVLQDLGNLLMAFIMLWAYLAFSQFLIIWSGNLPEEIPWYINRSGGGWQWIAALLAAFHFAVPFALLLARGNKRNKRIIAGIAAGVLAMRLLDFFWLIKPAFTGPVLTLHPLDFAVPIGIGGIWFSAWIGQMRRQYIGRMP